MARWGWQSNNRHFLIYFLTSLAFIVASVLSWRPATVVEQALTRSFTPFLAVASGGVYGFSDFVSSISQYFWAVSKNKSLTVENENLQRIWHSYLEVQAENNVLKEQMDFQKSIVGTPLSARVVADSASPFARSVLINTQSGGVEKGQAVVNEKGLVGRVVQTFGAKARVLLITDYSARIPVRVVENNEAGIVRGTNSPSLEMMLLENENAKIKAGMHVVTSGMGGVFSANIPIGLITKVEGKHIELQPYVNFSQLDIVTVKRRKIEGVVP